MARCRNPPRRLHGFKVAYSDKVGDGSYGGIHCYAAKELNIPFPYPCDVLLILKGMPKKETKETIFHEITEANIMKHTGMPYREAHRLTQKIEKKTR